MNTSKLLSRCYLTLIFLLLYFPIAYLIFYSFNAGDTMSGFSGFTLAHYQRLFANLRLWAIVSNTLVIALLSALAATMVGTLGAIAIHYAKKALHKRLLLEFNAILMVSPDVIIGASLLIMFTFIGFRLGFVSVLLAHIAFNIPIVVLMVLPRLEEMNDSMIMAAQDLGADNWTIFSKILLPTLTPGILTGYFMAFTYSLDDFAVTFFVTGNGFSTLAIEIYSQARTGVNLEINALSTVMFIFSMILVMGYYGIQKWERQSKGPLKIGKAHKVAKPEVK